MAVIGHRHHCKAALAPYIMRLPERYAANMNASSSLKMRALLPDMVANSAEMAASVALYCRISDDGFGQFQWALHPKKREVIIRRGHQHAGAVGDKEYDGPKLAKGDSVIGRSWLVFAVRQLHSPN